VIRASGDRSFKEGGANLIAASLLRNACAPTETSLVSWLLLTTIYDRPRSSRGLNAYLGVHSHGGVPEPGLSVPRRDTSFGFGFASCSPGLQMTL
jgi:hypothetical protein